MHRISHILHDHLAAFLSSIIMLFGSVLVFFLLSHIEVVQEVSANKVGIERNQDIGDELHGTLNIILGTVQTIALDMATVKEKVSSLEKQ